MSRRTIQRARAHRFVRFAAALCAVVLVGCATPNSNDTRSATAGMPNLSQELASREWILDPARSSLKTPVASSVTLIFNGHTVSGTGPCNTYRGHVKIDNDENTVEISDLAQTRLPCALTPAAAEQEYFAALVRVRDVDLSRGYTERRLVLHNGADRSTTTTSRCTAAVTPAPAVSTSTGRA
jgi:heat shock protein HslJ